jgi:Phosphopantetheine attachment site
MCYLLQTDRRALPRHEYEATAEYVAPASDLEAAVCSAWQAVLHRAEPISVHANFFELGGNSLQAGALCSRLHAELGRDAAIPIVWVIECQTIRALAARLADADTDVSRLPPLLQTVDANAGGIKQAPLSFQQVCTLLCSAAMLHVKSCRVANQLFTIPTAGYTTTNCI